MVSYGKTRSRCSCRLSLHPIRGKEGLSQLQLEKEMRFQLYGPAFNVQGILHESRAMSTLQNLWQQILKTMQLSKLYIPLSARFWYNLHPGSFHNLSLNFCTRDDSEYPSADPSDKEACTWSGGPCKHATIPERPGVPLSDKNNSTNLLMFVVVASCWR